MLKSSFNETKTINAVLYITNNLKRRDIHKIFKVLYFADRNHIVEYGRTITGDDYYALNDGPVPTKLYDIFKSIRGDGYFIDNGKFGSFFTVFEWDLIAPQKEPDLSKLSKSDIKHLDNSINLYGNLSWDEIREKSHDYAWRNTAKDKKISLENIILEAGESIEYIEYLDEINKIQNACL